MSHPLSQGIRIYLHDDDGLCLNRNSYNYGHGMRVLKELQSHLRIIGVGCESGAMVVHLEWK